MFKKIIALMLILSMALTLFACGNGGSTPSDGAQSNNSSDSDKSDTPNGEGEGIDISDKGNVEYNNNVPSGLKADKIGTLTGSQNFYLFTPSNSGGVYYQNDGGMYGIMSFDGKSDTGAKYTVCSPEKEYFQVTAVDTSTVTTIKDLNCFGLVDVNGKLIVPMEYAGVNVINERYARVFVVSGTTDSREDGLVFINNDNDFAIVPDGNDTMLSGTWYIFDMVAGKRIEGVSGTLSYTTNAYGDIVCYVSDDKEYVYINENGETLEGHNYFDDGSYVVDADGIYTYYNSDGNKIFSGSSDEFKPCGVMGEYIEASKYVDGKTVYALMDKSGKVVSGEFASGLISENGGLYFSDGALYSIDGKRVSPEGYKFNNFEDVYGFAWLLDSDDKTAVIDVEGNTILSCDNDDVRMSNYVAEKKIDGVTYCYSHKDKDFTIRASSYAPWLAKGSEDHSTNYIYDTISGEKIIDSYKEYSFEKVPGVGIYIYAENTDGVIDVYLVK